MIIAFDLQSINLNNLFIADTKRNIIMDGHFTKIIYSNNFFTMNGLYILFPIELTSIENAMNKKQMKYNPYSQSNLNIIKEFANFEYRLLDYYRQLKQISCSISNLLSKQLYTGFMKIYTEYNTKNNLIQLNNDGESKKTQSYYIIKVSGIWESPSEVGLTFKLFESNELN